MKGIIQSNDFIEKREQKHLHEQYFTVFYRRILPQRKMSLIQNQNHETIFAERLSLLMSKEGISPGELAKKTGIKERTIRLYLGGSTSPTSRMIWTLCNFFNCTSDYLIGLKKESKISSKAEHIALMIDSMRRFEQNWCVVLLEAINDKMAEIRNPKAKVLDVDFLDSIRNSS